MTVGGRYELSTTELQPGTFDGRHLVLQRAIQVHVLGRNRNTNMVVLERMSRLPEQRRRMIIDAGEHDGLTYVVTWPLEGGRSLMQWLGEKQEAVPPLTPQPSVAPPAPALPAAPAALPDLAPQPVVQPSPEPAMGDFTRMFSVRPAGRVPADPLAPNPASPPSSPAERQMGEFTRMFSAPAGARPAAEPAAAPIVPAMPPAPPAILPAPAAVPPPFAERKPGRVNTEGPGEFTLFFSPEVAAAKEEPPPLELGKPAEPLGFTQVFRRALDEPVRHHERPSPLPDLPQATERHAAPPPIPAGTLGGQAASGGTNDYSRIVGRPQLTASAPPFPAMPPMTPPALPKPSIPAPPPLPKPSISPPTAQIPAAKGGFPLPWLVGILAGLVVLAIAFTAIAIVVLKNR